MRLRFISKAVLPRLITALLSIAFLINGSSLAYANLPADKEYKFYYYLHDNLGGIQSVLDDKGNVVCTNDYLPYGEERNGDCMDKDEEDYGFTGKEKDEETGLMYYGARYYDPVIGRFTSPDPFLNNPNLKGEELQNLLRDPQSLNMYTYARNNPLKYADPDGKFAVIPALIAIAGFIGAFIGGIQNVAAPDIDSPPVYTKSEAEIITGIAIGEIAGSFLGIAAGKVAGLGFKYIGQLRKYKDLIAKGVGADEASKIAREGGKYYGEYANYADKSINELEKSIKSHQKQIEIHQNKIKNPEQYAENWDLLTRREKEGLINHWKSDLQRAETYKSIKKSILKEKKSF